MHLQQLLNVLLLIYRPPERVAEAFIYAFSANLVFGVEHSAYGEYQPL
jgi:hypothetical protein